MSTQDAPIDRLGLPLSEALRTELVSVTAQWQSNPQNTAAQVRAVADREPTAIVQALAAMLSAQAGEWPAAIPYAQRAAKAGILGPLQNISGNLLSDPNQAEQGVTFLRQLADAGFPIDPLAYVASAASSLTARPGILEELLEIAASRPAPAGLREQWESVISTARAQAAEVTDAAHAVSREREQIIAAMTADAQLVKEERARMGELVEEVADLANQGAADHLAKEYAKHAKEEEDTADSYTRWSIAFGIVSILATGVIAYLAFSKEHGTGAIATKAALALPIVVFAGYLGRLATVHRRQAWRWRNIELQIRTARPFVAPLRDDQRELMTAALALRFFPGQRPDGDNGSNVADPVSALAELLSPNCSRRRSRRLKRLLPNRRRPDRGQREPDQSTDSHNLLCRSHLVSRWACLPRCSHAQQAHDRRQLSTVRAVPGQPGRRAVAARARRSRR